MYYALTNDNARNPMYLMLEEDDINIIEPMPLSGVCPHCSHRGTFETLVEKEICCQDYYFGQRRCPNPKCLGHIFVIFDGPEYALHTYPTQKIPFEKKGIPENVLKAFEEAVVCHSNECFVASAIMLRKTLEEICIERNSTGKNLKDKLKDLGGKIFVPKELIEGMDELRLLGNDAAHIEAQAFNQIGKEEVEVSIEFTKEILKGVYQYEGLLSKLRNLKKRNP